MMSHAQTVMIDFGGRRLWLSLARTPRNKQSSAASTSAVRHVCSEEHRWLRILRIRI